MNMEHWWNDVDSRKLNCSEKKLSQYQHDHNKFFMWWTKWRQDGFLSPNTSGFPVSIIPPMIS
jgi:hypothetical protein